MPDKKPTDNEIAKALECSVNGKCPECPYFRSYPCDKCRNMRKDALDLINRQKEEIERLERQAKANDKYAEALKRGVEVLGEKIKTAKSEARKEFAERLESIYTNDKRYDRPNAHTMIVKLFDNIDNLLKEMERANND